MMKNTYLISLLITVILFACKDTKEGKTNKENIEETITIKNEQPIKESSTENTTKEFSWDDIPESTSDIGAYPYITPPKGMIVNKDKSESFEYGKLEMYDGNTFFVMKGKVDKLRIQMEGDQKWQKHFFDESVSEYLKSIGATLIYNDKIPYKVKEKSWGGGFMTKKKHGDEFYAGDPNNDPLSVYVLKTADKKIGFQVFSDTPNAIGIVELKDFKQTIEKITADDILNEINDKGFATLHINFDTGKSRIKADSYEVINEIAKMMKTNANLKISIEGHTDNVGNEASNMKLSKNRARSVLIALTDEDIDESRLKSEGFGQTKPIEDNATEEGKAKNRRVELRKI